MANRDLDPERGRATALKLRALGVKGILVAAAEQGYITQLACKMPECFCPEELGGACYFEPVTAELSDWMPTHEHFPTLKERGWASRPRQHGVGSPALQPDRLFDQQRTALREGSGPGQGSPGAGDPGQQLIAPLTPGAIAR